MRVFVYSPDYNHRSGGVFVMHYLMYLLQRAGHEVISNAAKYNPAYSLHPAYAPGPVSGDDMIIAPETIYLDSAYNLGLPVLRWVLYYPGKNENGGPVKYDHTEIVYHWDSCYAKAAAKASFSGESKQFSLPNLAREDYVSDGSIKREKDNLLFVYKGRNMRAHPKDALEITPKFPAERQAILRLFREYKNLYCYDRHTILTTEAALCGMNVMVWDYEKGSWEKFAVPETRFKDYEKDTQSVSALINDFNLRKAGINFDKDRKYRVNYLPRLLQRAAAKFKKTANKLARLFHSLK